MQVLSVALSSANDCVVCGTTTCHVTLFKAVDNSNLDSSEDQPPDGASTCDLNTAKETLIERCTACIKACAELRAQLDEVVNAFMGWSEGNVANSRLGACLKISPKRRAPAHFWASFFNGKVKNDPGPLRKGVRKIAQLAHRASIRPSLRMPVPALSTLRARSFRRLRDE